MTLAVPGPTVGSRRGKSADCELSPCPDGQTLFALGVHDRGELVRFDTRLRDFVEYLAGISAAWVTFSRDAQWVAYVSQPEDTLWRSRIDGSEKRQLTFEPLLVDGVSWSPDAKRIAFRGWLPGTRANVYTVPAGGGQPEALIQQDLTQGVPTWSADGTRLAYSDVPEKFGIPAGTEVIHVYDLTRHESTALTQSGGLWTSRWSPDGRYLCALTIEGQKLMLFDFTSGKWRSLGVDHVNNPTWSRDGTHIYYDTEGTVHVLRRVRISDGRMEELASLAGYPSTTYWWSGVALDDSPIILRNLGAVEVYALDIERH